MESRQWRTAVATYSRRNILQSSQYNPCETSWDRDSKNPLVRPAWWLGADVNQISDRTHHASSMHKNAIILCTVETLGDAVSPD